MKTFRFLALFFLASTFLAGGVVYASESSGTIESGNSSARVCKDPACGTYGRVNWKPTGATAVTVTDSGLTGYAWGDEIGWINLDPTDAGVTINSTTGELSGYAYANTGSWINFNPTDAGSSVGVTINSSGQFTGWAWVSGVNGGWMKFDCVAPETCVKTDWRPLGSRSQAGDPGITGGSSASAPASPYITPSLPPPAPEGLFPRYTDNNILEFFIETDLPTPSFEVPGQVESFNAPLFLKPEESGLLVWDFSSPEMNANNEKLAITVEVPPYVSEESFTLSVEKNFSNEPTDTIDFPVTVIGGVIFNVTALNSENEYIRSFKEPLKITLFMPENLQGREDLSVYYLEDDDSKWELVEDVEFGDASVTFFVDHLTRFAVVAGADLPDKLPATGRESKNIWWQYLLIAAVAVFVIQRFILRETHGFSQ